MSSHVTAVSYGLKLSLPEVQRLRALLAAAGLACDAETRTGDGRFEVYVRSFPDGQQSFAVSTEGGIVPQVENMMSKLRFTMTDRTTL